MKPLHKGQKIWFDFDNSPHVPVLMPVARELERRGYGLYFTARDVAQTKDLLKIEGVIYDLVGGEFSSSKYRKITGTVSRALRLAHILKKENVACCVSHCSRSAILAGWLLRKPVITMFDYEYVNSFFQHVLADAMLMPETVASNIKKLAKLHYYPGLKEHFYLSDYVAGEDPFAQLGIPADALRVLLRLPAQFSHYHNPKTDEILSKILIYLREIPGIYLIVLPRNKEQSEQYKTIMNALRVRYVVLDKVFVGGDIIFFSDAVFSGGGTMAREAAVMGTPSYSFFMGKKGGVDISLEQAGRLTFVRSEADLNKILLTRKKEYRLDLLSNQRNGKYFVVQTIEKFIR